MFPAPREVDRYLYGDERRPDQISCAEQFPAPLEVDRYLYLLHLSLLLIIIRLGFRPPSRLIGSYTQHDRLENKDFYRFPAPREVVR